MLHLTHLHLRTAASGLPAESRGSAPCPPTELCTIGTIIYLFIFLKTTTPEVLSPCFNILACSDGEIIMKESSAERFSVIAADESMMDESMITFCHLFYCLAEEFI